MLKSLLCLVLPSAAVVISAAGAMAQVRGEVRIGGTVIDDESAAPIPGVRLELLNRRGSVLARSITGDDGSFRFVVPQHGAYRFRADRIGYQVTTTPALWTEDHDTVRVEIRLDPDAVLLAPLEVTAWSRRVRPSPVTEGFRDRLGSGIGHFFTREDIERRRPALVTDLLASVPGVHLQSSGRGMQRQVLMTRRGEHCPAQIFVDGFLLNGSSRATADADFTLDDAVSPAVVEGIEVYQGLSTIPAQFLNPDARCGAVVVWTRRGA